MKFFVFMASFFLSGLAIADPADYVIREETYEGQHVRVVHPRHLPEVIGPDRARSIINGRKTKPGEFPGVFQMVGTENGSGFSRTVSLSGPKLVVTAAHCIGDTNHLKAAGQLIALECEIEPNEVDGALCELSEAVVSDKYVNLPFDNNQVRVTENKDSVGFGVTNNDGSCGDCGIQHVGEDMTVFQTSGQEYRTRNALKTVLGFGDSGGPSMRNLTNPSAESQIGDGIHSAVLVDDNDNILDVSIMVDVTESRMQSFIRDFVDARGLEACGLNADCGAALPPACVEEQGALDQAIADFQRKEAEFQLCRQEKGAWRCIKQLSGALKAWAKVKKAERDLKRCQQG